MVVVQTLGESDNLEDQLALYGFERTLVVHRLLHRGGGFVHILPYSESIAPGDRLQLGDDLVLNMAGFRHVVSQAVPTASDDGPTLALA